MNEPEPSPDHAASWRQLRASLEVGPGGQGSSAWQGMAIKLLSELDGFGLASLLRVTRVADRLALALAGTENPEDAPRVTLTFLPEDQTVRVAYSRWNIETKAPLIEAWVSAPVAVQVTFGTLRRLWTETHPTLPLPEELRRA